MKFYISLFFPLFMALFACQNSISPNKEVVTEPTQIVFEPFQNLIDSLQLKGMILVHNPQENKTFCNNYQWAGTGFIPASTFKIPNSIIALETGVVKGIDTTFEWDGTPRPLSIWEKDMNFREAFQLSCVPCYQGIARKIGPKRMNAYLNKLQYPGMQVSTDNIDLFWLEGASKISPLEQLDFLQRYYFEKLPIKPNTYNTLKQMFLIEQGEDYSWSGKTGWAVREGTNIGWFVGYLEKEGKVYFVVTNVQPTTYFQMEDFAAIRRQISKEAFRLLKISPL